MKISFANANGDMLQYIVRFEFIELHMQFRRLKTLLLCKIISQ